MKDACKDKIDRLKAKIDLKKYNKKNTDEEYLKLLDEMPIFSIQWCDEDAAMDAYISIIEKTGLLSPFPAMACQQIIPVFKDCAEVANNCYERFRECETEECLATYWESCKAMLQTSDVLVEKMIEFGEYEESYEFEDLEVVSCLEIDCKKCGLYYLIRKNFDMLEKIINYSENAVKDLDKSKCMSLSAYMAITTYNLHHLYKLIKEKF